MREIIHLVALPDSELRLRSVYERIWREMRILDRDIRSRRLVLEQLFRLYEPHVKITWHGGMPWVIPQITRVFKDDDNRWHSIYRQANALGTGPRVYARTYDRIRLYALYIDLRKAEGSFPD